MTLFERTVLFVLLSLPFVSLAQPRFNEAELNRPGRYGRHVSDQLNLMEVYEYKKDPTKHCIFLKNGFRSSTFANAAEWLAVRDTSEAYRIDIVYSKYPLRNGVYPEIYPLLLNRIRAIINLDSAFNDVGISWNKILQTHCVNDAQVNSLFHGVVIWYRTQSEVESDPETESDTLDEPVPVASSTTGQRTQPVVAFEAIKSTGVFADTTVKRIQALPAVERIDAARKVLEEKVEKEPVSVLATAGDKEMKAYQAALKNFSMRYFTQDEVVGSVFTRHPEWRNILVINDWTGSMYGYGAAVLQWHLANFKKSGITTLTLFNDGDSKSTYQKKLGETGGIYHEKADNIMKLVALFNLVMLKGSGGDGPENNVEAVLRAVQQNPGHKEVVLIADNNSCIRDIQLADSIRVPVRIIVCGYVPAIGINRDLVYLARKTNGGLYTVEQDIENIKATTGRNGIITSLKDDRIIISPLRCDIEETSAVRMKDSLYKDFEGALQDKEKVRRLELSSQALNEVPKKIQKLELLYELDLSRNNIKEVPRKFTSLELMRSLNLSQNRLTAMPEHIDRLRSLAILNLSNNELTELSRGILHLSSLRVLDLSNNRIAKITGEATLFRLEFMNLANNQIAEIPASFGALRGLKILDLSGNRLTAIPDFVINFTKLVDLNLNNNGLTRLPAKIWKLRKLQVLKLEGNNFPQPEKERIRRCFPSTTIYF